MLGQLLESSFRRSMRLLDGDLTGFVQRPVSATLVGLLVVAVVLVPLLRTVRRKQNA